MKKLIVLSLALVSAVSMHSAFTMEGEEIQLGDLPAEVITEILGHLSTKERMDKAITILGKEGLFEEPEEGKPRMTADYAQVARIIKNSVASDQLLDAIQKDKAEKVKELLKKEAYVNVVNFKDRTGESALMNAVTGGNLDIVRLLLDNKANVNAQDRTGASALMNSVIGGNLDIVRLLLDNKADVNAQDRTGASALMNAVTGGNLDIVRLLLDNKANVNAQDRTGESALMNSVIGGNLDIVRLLLDNKADVNAQDKTGASALMNSVIGGNLDIVRLLLDNKADVNAQDKTGASALMYATIFSEAEIVKLLLERGANPSLRITKGIEPKSEVAVFYTQGADALTLAKMYLNHPEYPKENKKILLKNIAELEKAQK